jgi:hypothetical protein
MFNYRMAPPAKKTRTRGPSQTTEVGKMPDFDAIKLLEQSAINFLHNIRPNPAASNMQVFNIPLPALALIHPSPKFLPLALSFLPDGHPRMSLFFVLGGEVPSKFKFGLRFTRNNISKMVLHDKLISFFKEIFTATAEHVYIENCVNRSNSLLVAATTDKDPDNYFIVSGVNFSFLDSRGIFINYLATTKATITTTDFKRPFFEIENSEVSTWYHRHFSTFLLHTLRVAILAQSLQDDGSFTVSKCPFILQCRFDPKENADKYYLKIGFRDYSIIDSESELRRELPVHGPLICQNQRSLTNLASFIYETNVQVMVHDSGDVECEKFPRFTLSNSYFPLFTMEQQRVGAQRKTFFPFHIRREHLMILVSDLETLYLPFTVDLATLTIPFPTVRYIELDRFLLPNEAFGHDQLVKIDDISRESLIPVPNVPRSGWVEGDIIQFMIRW